MQTSAADAGANAWSLSSPSKRRTIAAWLGLQRSAIEALIQDHGRVAVAAAIALGSFHQPVDLALVRCSRSRPISRLLSLRSATVRNSESRDANRSMTSS
jgi:hypothetical protein